MKNAKLALIIALVMIVLRTVLCVVLLVFGAITFSNETNRIAPEPPKMQGSLQQQLQATMQQAQAVAHVKSIQRDQVALYWEIVGLAWNLLLAGLLIFAVSRFQKSN